LNALRLSGLGLATTKRLLDLGAKVAVIDLQLPQRDYGLDQNRCRCFKADVSNAEEVQKAIEDIIQWSESTSASISAVICCAGFLGPKKILSKSRKAMELNHFKKVIDISLNGTIDVIRQLLPKMASQKEEEDGERGVIITVASAAAFDGQPGQVAYSAAKGAIASLTLPMARDLAPVGIRVVSIAPGMFKTNMVSEMPEKARESLNRVLEFPVRGGKPSEFAAMVEHILSNVMLNGTVIRLDGATRMPSRM
jgi:3-hydroxyacyl-CoA dehydrogenase/3-hydroxy-2-methylbutyryl-CoA dehydrogenase